MKTLTEFFGPHLLRALQTRDELVAAGKTPEELPVAMGEALKLEGDKLQRLLVALEIAEKKKDRLKRIVVLQPAEGQKAPSGAQEKDGLLYLPEFFPAPPGSEPQKRGGGEGRDDRRGGRGGKKERGRRGGRDGEKRGPGRGRDGGRAQAAPETGGAPVVEGNGDTDQRRRRRRGPRGPRPEVTAASSEPLKAPTPRPASPKPASAGEVPAASGTSSGETS